MNLFLIFRPYDLCKFLFVKLRDLVIGCFIEGFLFNVEYVLVLVIMRQMPFLELFAQIHYDFRGLLLVLLLF